MNASIRALNISRRIRFLRLVNRIMIAFFLLAGMTALFAIGSVRFAVPVLLLASLLVVSEILVHRGRHETAVVLTLVQIYLNVLLVIFALPFENFLELYRYQTFIGAYLFVATLVATRSSQLLVAGGACFVAYNLGALLKVAPALAAATAGLPGAFISAYVAGNLGLVVLTIVATTLWRFTARLVGEADRQRGALERRDALIRESAEKAQGGFSIGDQIQALTRESETMTGEASRSLREVSETIARLEESAGLVDGALAEVERQSHTLARELDRTSERSRQSSEGVRDILTEIATIEARLGEIMDRTRERRAQLPQRQAAVTAGGARLQAVIDAVGELDTIARLVGDIAARTQVLAMNALIVAARSTGHGKQFAVVAREVQSLALEVESHTARIRDVAQEAGHAADGARAVGTEFESLYTVYAEDLSETAAALEEVGTELQQITVGAGVIRLSVEELDADTTESLGAMRSTEEALSRARPTLETLGTALGELNARITAAVASGDGAGSRTRDVARMSAEHMTLLGELVATINTDCDDLPGCIDADVVDGADAAAPDSERTRPSPVAASDSRA